jgi:hypothetical protein
MRTRPERTASMAGRARSSIAMNHCSEISGSIRSPERWLNGTSCVYSSVWRMSPCSASAATTFSRASSTVKPA